MQSYTRHKLKEDKFQAATKEAVHWSAEHRNTITVVTIIVVVALVGWLGFSTYTNSQNDKASLALGNAMRIYESPLRAADAAVQPGETSFASIAERGAAANKEFLKIADSYPFTKNGRYARYMAGVTAMEKGDNAQAEQLLKTTAGYDKDTSALAKMALAALYRAQQKNSEAAKYYNEVVQADAVTAPKTTAQLELAQMYEPKQPAEAIKVYEEIVKEEQASRKATAGNTAVKPGAEGAKSPVEQLAESKITQLKGGAPKKAE